MVFPLTDSCSAMTIERPQGVDQAEVGCQASGRERQQCRATERRPPADPEQVIGRIADAEVGARADNLAHEQGILAEQDDEWQDGRRYFRPETLALIDAEPDVEEVPAMLMAS
jgi:hypothetical protein